MLKVKIFKKLNQITINVSFFLKRKEYIIMLGKSGAGKSTIAKIIAGLETLDTGEIILNNRNISNLPPERRNISYLPQSNSLFPHMTVIENLKFPFIVRRRKVDLKQIENISVKFGIKKILYKKPSEISGGEAQRVALARAILSEPEVIILDEPLNSLDFVNKLELMNYLRKIKGERTVIHITHDPIEAKNLADKVLYLENGQLLFFGSWKDFIEKAEGELPRKIRSVFHLY